VIALCKFNHLCYFLCNNSGHNVFLLLQFCALFGMAVAPVCYCTVYRLTGSYFASVLAASLIVFGKMSVWHKL